MIGWKRRKNSNNLSMAGRVPSQGEGAPRGPLSSCVRIMCTTADECALSGLVAESGPRRRRASMLRGNCRPYRVMPSQLLVTRWL